MNEEWSRIAAGSIQHEALMARLAFEQTLYPYQEPSAIYRPSLGIDGNKWCALYGEDLMHGVAGFGHSPELAMADFNKNWRAKLPHKETK